MGRQEVDVTQFFGKKESKEQKQQEQSSNTLEVSIDLIDDPIWQPRQAFPEEQLKELAQSIEQHGLIQPLAVEKQGDRYRLISGHRRLKALRLIGADTVPINIIDNLTDDDRTQIQIAENLIREDITPIERANAIYKLFQKNLDPILDNVINKLTLFRRDKSRLDSKTVDTVSTLLGKIGKSAKTVERWLSLLKLPPELQKKLDDPNGVFTPKHAGEILKLTDIKEQLEIVSQIEQENLSVEQTKEVVESKKDSSNKPKLINPSLFIKRGKNWISNIDTIDFTKTKDSEIQAILKEISLIESYLEKLKSRLRE